MEAEAAGDSRLVVVRSRLVESSCLPHPSLHLTAAVGNLLEGMVQLSRHLLQLEQDQGSRPCHSPPVQLSHPAMVVPSAFVAAVLVEGLTAKVAGMAGREQKLAPQQMVHP